MVYIIKAVTPEHITDKEIELVAKEMVNIVHGTQYYDSKGIELKVPKREYLGFEKGTMSYECLPVRGTILVNSKNELWGLNISLTSLKKKLDAAFLRANKWPFPGDVYRFTEGGGNQFTMECAPCNNVVRVVETDPLVFKQFAERFTWHITNRRRLFQYQMPGVYLKTPHLLSAMSMIVLDLKTTMPFDHGYFSLSFPKFPYPVQVFGGKIHIDPYLGIDAHIYNHLGGKYVESNFQDLAKVIIGEISYDNLVVQPYAETAEQHKDPIKIFDIDVDEKRDEKKDEKKRAKKAVPVKRELIRQPEACHKCGIKMFDAFYAVKRTGKTICICKFCAHFSYTIANLNPHEYTVAKCQHPLTRAMFARTMTLTALEKEIIDILISKEDQLKLVRYNSHETPEWLKTCGGNILLGPGIIGFKDQNDFDDISMLEMDKVPKNTIFFSFSESV